MLFVVKGWMDGQFGVRDEGVVNGRFGERAGA